MEKIRNYTLTEIQTFLKDFVRQEGERGVKWLLWVCGTGSELVLTTAKMCYLANISKDLKFHPSYKLISSEIPQILGPLSFPLNGTEPRNASHEASLSARNKLMGLSRHLVRRKREKGWQRPLEPLLLTPGSSFSSCGYLLPGTLLILPSQ